MPHLNTGQYALPISCHEEDGKWGIWLQAGQTSHLIQPVLLFNTIFCDQDFYLNSACQIDNRQEVKSVEHISHGYVWCMYPDNSYTPTYFVIDGWDYGEMVIECIEKLHKVWSSGKVVIYEECNVVDFATIDLIHKEVRMAHLKTTLMNWHEIPIVAEEPFTFAIDLRSKICTIGIADRLRVKPLDYQLCDYDCLRHDFENLVYHESTCLDFSFCNGIRLIIKKSRIAIEKEDFDGLPINERTDTLLVEIRDDQVIPLPIIQGWCPLRETVRTLYQTLLDLANSHQPSPAASTCPDQESYDTFKSPLIERFIASLPV